MTIYQYPPNSSPNTSMCQHALLSIDYDYLSVPPPTVHQTPLCTTFGFALIITGTAKLVFMKSVDIRITYWCHPPGAPLGSPACLITENHCAPTYLECVLHKQLVLGRPPH